MIAYNRQFAAEYIIERVWKICSRQNLTDSLVIEPVCGLWWCFCESDVQHLRSVLQYRYYDDSYTSFIFVVLRSTYVGWGGSVF